MGWLLGGSWLWLNLVWAAPVPRYRPPAIPVVVAGWYELTWSNITGELRLDPEGNSQLKWSGQTYRGTWFWESRTRTVHFSDTTNGGISWLDWSVTLGDRWETEAEGRYWTPSGEHLSAKARLKPLKKASLPRR
jgi:hypothetical protein